MATLSTGDLTMDDFSSSNLTSTEIDTYIKNNFGLNMDIAISGVQVQETQAHDSGASPYVMQRNNSTQSPMFSGTVLSQAVPLSISRPETTQPYAEIVEQPQARGLRFRYECEGRSAGSIPGEHSTPERKTFPTLKIRNYKGSAIVVASCVTKDGAPHCKPHPHSLVGKDCKKGVCTVKVKDTDTITFPHLGIQCAKKKDVANALKIRKEINVDPYQTGFSHGISQIDLNVVRLCFQVFLPDDKGKINRVVAPVVSHIIHDKKSVNELTICRVDRSSGKAKGGDEMFLLCEKVNKDDIQVRFYEDNQSGCAWEDFGDFGQGDVHRQFAIVFKSPAYREPFIQHPVEVMLQLRRPSDQETSESIPFTYMPEDPDPDRIEDKRRRKATEFLQSWSKTDNTGSTIKDGLRIKLKANRKMKPDASPPLGGLPQYSFANTGASATVVGISENHTLNYRTVDNTGVGNMTIADDPPAVAAQQEVRIDESGKVVDMQYQIAEAAPLDINASTIDLALLQAYISEASGGDLSGNLFESTFDPNIAAMESVTSHQIEAQPENTFAATMANINNLNENP